MLSIANNTQMFHYLDVSVETVKINRFNSISYMYNAPSLIGIPVSLLIKALDHEALLQCISTQVRIFRDVVGGSNTFLNALHVELWGWWATTAVDYITFFPTKNRIWSYSEHARTKTELITLEWCFFMVRMHSFLKYDV